MLNEPTMDSLPLHTLGHRFAQARYPTTPLTDAFWDVRNLTHIFRLAEVAVGAAVKMPVTIVADDWFFLEAAKLATQSPGEVQWLPYLNRAVVHRVTEVHIATINQRKLYLKWFIYNDRKRFVERPRDTHGRRRVMRPSASEYTLANPDTREFSRHQAFVARQNAVRSAPTLFDRYLK